MGTTAPGNAWQGRISPPLILYSNFVQFPCSAYVSGGSSGAVPLEARGLVHNWVLLGLLHVQPGLLALSPVFETSDPLRIRPASSVHTLAG